jgi:Zn-dependent protease
MAGHSVDGARGKTMNARLELGRIAGIPIYLDMMFLLVMFVFSHRYFTTGDSQMMSVGLLIIAGIIGSILLHELGHAFAARMFKTGVSEIELTGLGGVARFSSSLPRAVLPRVIIYLAGPAANLVLWLGLAELVPVAVVNGKPIVASVLAQLAGINFFLLIFNLLPAYPLDGGHTLDAILGKLISPLWGQRITGALGCVVALVLAFFAIQSLPGSIFLLFLAFFLAQLNWEALQTAGGFKR